MMKTKSLKQIIICEIVMILLISSAYAIASDYEIYYYHNDHLGSPTAVTNSEGLPVWRADYYPFGETVNEEGDGKIKYNSKEEDDTGLLYYGARYYNPRTGRFITADTVKGELTDSQSQNRYVYVQNNPIKYIDPTGNQKKHAVLMPASLNKEHSEMYVQEFIEFMKANPKDNMQIIVFGNIGDLSEKFDGFQKVDVRTSAQRTLNLNKELTNYLDKNNPGLNIDISLKTVDYKKFYLRNMDAFIDKLIGDTSGVDHIYTAGHGVTAEGGFRTFSDNTKSSLGDKGINVGYESMRFSWGNYFSNSKWLDLTCGSTCGIDVEFSSFSVGEGGIDNRIRRMGNTNKFMEKGFGIKQQMKEYMGYE